MSTLKILQVCSGLSKINNLKQLKCIAGFARTHRYPVTIKSPQSSYHSLTLRCITPINNMQISPQKMHVKQSLPGHHQLNKSMLLTFTRGFKIEVTNKVVDNIYIPTPVETCYELLENFHDMYGLPWWLTIVASTVMLRFVFIMPLAILHQKVMARIEATQIEINTYAEQLKQQTAVMAKEGEWSQRKMADVYSEQISGFVKKVHMRENCRPIRLTYVSIAQVATWVTMTTAIGQMTCVHPYLFGTDVDIDFLPALLTEGTLWFQNLVQSDLILPFLLGASNISLVLLWSLRRGPLTRTQHRLQYLLFSLSIGLVPAAIAMPAAVTLYWTTSSLCGIGQFFLLRIPSVRRLLQIPLVPSEMKQPLQEMQKIFKIRFRSKKYF